MAIRSSVAVVAVLASVLGAGVATVTAEPPSAIETLRRHFDAVFAMLRSPGFLEKDAEARREAIRGIGARLFDWPEMSRRALGPHWADRTAAERRAFAGHFARVAERAYLSQVDRVRAGHVMQDPVRYLGETTDASETIVHTQLAYLRNLPADFRMRYRDAKWEVCDVVVGGVSATANYRAQFDRLLAHGSYPALLDRMTAQGGEETEGAQAAPR